VTYIWTLPAGKDISNDPECYDFMQAYYVFHRKLSEVVERYSVDYVEDMKEDISTGFWHGWYGLTVYSTSIFWVDRKMLW